MKRAGLWVSWPLRVFPPLSINGRDVAWLLECPCGFNGLMTLNKQHLLNGHHVLGESLTHIPS